MILDFEPGDKVINPNNKDWGTGQVQSIINGKSYCKFWKCWKKKLLIQKIIQLEKLYKWTLKEKKKINSFTDRNF